MPTAQVRLHVRRRLLESLLLLFGAQRLAWARQHCVPVPQSLVKQAKNTATSKSTGCCDLKSSPSHPNGAQPGGTLGFLARQCHGEQTLWGCGEPAPVPAPIVQWSFDACCVDWCLNFSWRRFPSSHFRPTHLRAVNPFRNYIEKRPSRDR